MSALLVCLREVASNVAMKIRRVVVSNVLSLNM
jgi:hypothetical protein